MTANEPNTRLNRDNLTKLASSGVDIPEYRLTESEPEIGIVHIGPGAFFRAHQAWYTHRVLKLERGNWCISAVSLHSFGVSDALTEQDGLYCLAELDTRTNFEVVGAIKEVLVAQRDYTRIILRLANEHTKIVTMTITEKGYCLNTAGQLDMSHPDIQHDIAVRSARRSAVGILVEALSLRFQNGQTGLSIVSCDNITGNGGKLKGALIEFAQHTDPELAKWLVTELICPATMVDSITPATDDDLRGLVEEELQVKDNWPIKRESYLQWVIEDCLGADRPGWELAGAIFTEDVEGFEKAKLRLLNCPHSTLAYIGCLLEIETVFDAMHDSRLLSLIKTMIEVEILPSIQGPKELDAWQYSEDILQRFNNPAIRHLVTQIAWDGSQKIPMRILPIIEQNLLEERSISLLCYGLASWMLFVRKQLMNSEKLVDPLADALQQCASACLDNAQHDVGLFLSLSQVFAPELAGNNVLVEKTQAAYERLLPLLTNSEYEWSV